MDDKTKDKIKEYLKKFFKGKYGLGFVVFVTVVVGLLTWNHFNKPDEISYNEFTAMVEDKDVEIVTIDFSEDIFELENVDGEKYLTDNPRSEGFKKYLLENDIEVEAIQSSKYTSVFFSILQIVIYIVFFGLLMSKMGIGALKKRESLVASRPGVKFGNIAGNEEAKEDMMYLVNSLKNPEAYDKIGAKLPKGVVLYGPPGTGKTLTAKAIAGEASVPFFSITGSDFIEMYAGLGAKRVRELYTDAKAAAPSIVFIDEIDAIGTKRGVGANSGERDQTINALLNELDGFNKSNPVITIVATNRVEDLDAALVRPGRFDKHIAINLPDKEDRLKILNVHSANKKLSESVDLKEVSNITIGFSGAALEALMNEAAILSVNAGLSEIGKEQIDEAYYKMLIGGHMKKNKHEDLDEIELVAYHEAGHALATKLLTDNNVPKVTIIPSTTGMGGATLSVPKRTGLMTKREVLNNIKVLYAGRAAELILKGDEDLITTGASNDIKEATKQINGYFSAYGMSREFGMIEVSNSDKYLNESIKLSNKLYDETVVLLKENKDKLVNVANALIEKETIGEEELDILIQEDGGN